MRTLPFAKGHGTENDFVLVPDPDGRFDLAPPDVVALCDRRAGIGADGVLRVVRAAAVPEGVAAGAEWFMDYRNGDGSVAETCGNGLRVFVAYLVDAGLATLADGESLDVATRAGVVPVRREGDLFAATLGPWSIPGGAAAVATGADATVAVGGEAVPLPGLSVLTGNPHTVVALPDRARLAALDLARPPLVDPAPPHGSNVEIAVPLHDATAATGHLAVRIHERGVGETRSCGTGAVAAVLAARAWAGGQAPDVWQVDVPGGRLRVTLGSGDRLAGRAVELAGPATLVAEGTVRLPG